MLARSSAKGKLGAKYSIAKLLRIEVKLNYILWVSSFLTEKNVFLLERIID